MRINITGTNLKLDKNFKSYVNKKMKRILNHFENPINIHVIFKKEKLFINSEIIINADGGDFCFKNNGRDIVSSFDVLIDKCERHISKFKDRQKEHHKKHGFFVKQKLINPKSMTISIEGVKDFTLKPMSIEEAVLQFHLLKHDVFVFKYARDYSTGIVFLDSKEIHIVFKRKPFLGLFRFGSEYFYKNALIKKRKEVKIKKGGKYRFKKMGINDAIWELNKKKKVILFRNEASGKPAIIHRLDKKSLGYMEIN